MENKNLAMGLWKITKTPLQAILDCAQELVNKDHNYLQMCVRKASKDEHAICFIYKLNGNAPVEKAQSEYIKNTQSFLKSQFGNSLSGHDISSPLFLIKDGRKIN